MKRLILIALIVGCTVPAHFSAWAFSEHSVKLTPDGVDYPLIRLTPYRSPTGDPYARSFGIRRWLNPAGSEKNDFDLTFKEANDMFELYSGYGVLGHGEAVFTNAAAHWRKLHRGR